ncbi:MBL fold metallo-hydrolase [Chitinophaga nivalis]|uniref:MBL fold metallo-hydrolase n=1 Tax=Chitinophaga nivalis TaxID=2991709 RepID=A0ABT3IGK5_9BACT|nr:MBL fold metallo-hydrolase [Chitinophaga nivalis]MCW3467237.1 MBL fold metallo-hydrolase [Chitinophaga nivalis]MCW3483071.1 MBL fold metallo-hydrolase [Chitinophaga nivalis]
MQKKSMTAKEKMQRSANFSNGVFQNLSLTPMKLEDVTYFSMLKDALNRPADTKPAKPLPTIKTDLKKRSSEKPVIVWFGHSSYLIQVKGVNILVDPVFSGSASPFSFMVKAFPGADAYQVKDMPDIDAVIITHNHYDHLDTKTIAQLKSRTGRFYTALGVGRDIAGCAGNNVAITEMDWWDTEAVAPGITLTATPARHFSGRGLKRGGSLWASFVLEIFGYKIFIGGDSGYDSHFKTIGDKLGPFDIALLECGQYNEAWPFIHMMPEQTVQAAIDLQAKVLMPVHWAKFALSLHPWNEPAIRVTKSAALHQLAITTPRIGEPVVVGESYPQDPWWNQI